MTRPARTRPDLRPVAMFLVRCLAYWGAALWAVSRMPAIENFGVGATVAALHWILRIFGTGVARSDSALFVGGTSVEIVSDCSPHMPYLIFAAVVLAFPAPWRQRLFGLAAGALVIHVFNIVRILALIGVLVWHRPWFEFAHVYLWQTGTILVVFATFAIWLKSLAPRARST